jgi:hypothetical protein
MAYAAARADEPDHAAEVLEDIRQDISADHEHLREARDRRDLVTDAAKSFPHTLRAFNSGSVAHGTVNKPVDDADCGVVLDRRHYTDLGPDSDEKLGPHEIMGRVRKHVMEEVWKEYPDATSRLTKRAILIRFKKTVDGVDPSVDLIVALSRKGGEKGLLIPNRDTDDWDPSDPVCHTELLSAKPKDRRVLRARVVRLAKAAIKQDSKPVVSSFNVEALVMECIDDGDMALDEALECFFDHAASSIKAGLTDDPADVSGKIKLPDGMTRQTAAKRLRFFADKVAEARNNSTDRAAVEKALADLYPDQLPDAARSAAAQLASELDKGNASPRVSSAFGLGSTGLKTTRSHGDA